MEFTREVEAVMRSHADDELAGPMQAYIKDHFTYLGIKAPLRNKLIKPFLAKTKLPPIEQMENITRIFWNFDEREFQYVGMEFMIKYHRQFLPEHIVLFEYTLVTKSWWDTVDLISTKCVGPIIKLYPELRSQVIDGWIKSDNMWLNRSAMLFQLKYKGETDTDYLTKAILPHLQSTEFFHRKAIGWVLREYGKTNPDFVLEFVKKHEMSPLSYKEATRIIL